VLITLGDTSIVAITDSLGWFTLDTLADGRWTVGVSYPYFEKTYQEVTLEQGEPVHDLDVTLRQQLRFSTTPADTTLSIQKDALASASYFDLPYWTTYVVNLTETLIVIGSHGTQINWALKPLDHAWAVDGCEKYERVYAGVFGQPFGVQISANDSTQVPSLVTLLQECLTTGTYSVSFLVVDTIHNHFFFDDPLHRDPNPPLSEDLKAELQESLHRKEAMLSHVTVRFEP
jgi:hypothetical protein